MSEIKYSDITGVLLVDKEPGMTSHDVVAMVRSRFKVKKVGHAGTLDPAATGLMVILLGRSATRMSSLLSGQDKEYLATIKFGERTDSGDAQGKMIFTGEVHLSVSRLNEAINKFTGDIEQVPPMVSAKKVNGKRLYALARRGVEVERAPVKIRVNEFELLSFEPPFAEVRVLCSKGTYIRQLADDLGQELGCGAHLSSLRRTRSGDFLLNDAYTIEQIKQMSLEVLHESIIRIPGR